MGVDTECDVVIEARQRAQVRREIRRFRDRLIAEHLGADLEAFAEKAKKVGSMARAIDAFGSRQRSLRPLKAPKLPEEVLEAARIGDPEKPIALDTIVRQFSPEAEAPRFAPGPLLIALTLVVLIGLAFIWRYTPLAAVVTPDAVISWAKSFASHWWAPLVIILAYTPAMVVMFPRPLITLTAVLTFGASAGFAYAMTGVLLAALVGFFTGEFVKRDTVRKLAGPRLNKISHLLHRGGLVAVTIVRLLPIAPFVVVSAVMGAMRIRLPNYVIGTALGMTPGMLAATVLSDQFAAALVNPADVNGWAIAGAVLGLAALAGMGHWWLGRGRAGA
jgi:uncharacterized membrane protein YdjX (TVP38/TMEM64 family)